MAKQKITVELDAETITFLASLSEPGEALARLAEAAAERRRDPDQQQRDQTDTSLRIERDEADLAVAETRDVADEVADEVVRVARQRADGVVRTARDDADHRREPRSPDADTERARARADELLAGEHAQADAGIRDERAARRGPDDFLAVERDATDQDLSVERLASDTLHVDQRKANEQIVLAAVRAHDMTDEAVAARELTEATAQELRTVAEYREMFIGILGHDLRNPLASIVTASALLLRRGRLHEQDAATVSRIIRGSQRITRMITQLLDLTRARLGGGMPVDPRPTDMRDLCRDVVEESEAAVELQVEGDVAGTWDPDRMMEVLSNLTGNAVEHAAPETAVTVRARAEGAEVVVEVSNQGDPIPPEVLPFIFEPFRRAQQGKSSVAGNLGLGLYIAQRIVLAHGGTLGARSADGTTTFTMRLPRRPTQAA